MKEEEKNNQQKCRYDCQQVINIQQGDWADSEIQFKYEKLKFHDLFNRSMEIVFHKIQKWGI